VIAAIYARKSTEDTRSKEEGKSTARQIENATAYAVAKGWTVDPDLIFVDENISGGEFVNRPGLAACRAAGAAHRFERLVVMERSRIGRATIRTLAVIEELEESGVEVHAYGGQGIIRSGNVETLVGAYSDTQEKTQASNRTREGLTKKALQGHATGGRPYGYVVVRKGGHSEYQIDPEQAAIIKQAFQWSASGLGDDRVRNRLTELTGTPWRKNRVRRLLSNPMYIGQLAWGRTRVTPRGGQAKRRVRTAGPAVLVERPELRIIDESLWNQVRARKAATTAHYSKGGLAIKPAAGTATKYLLTGILRCGTCNSTMTMLGGNGRRYYCLGRAQKGPTFCSNRSSVPMDILDKAVIGILLDELLSDPERLWDIIREREAQRAVLTAPVVVTMAREIAKLEKEIANLVKLAADGDQDILAGMKERRGRIELLRAKEKAAPAPVTKESVLKGYAAFRTKINRKNPQEVRALLARLGCDRIIVNKTGLNRWEFEGSFDAGRIVAPTPPVAPSLIETDADGYLLNIAPAGPKASV
jgi:DNA invertase Pin-like site-specific DNA recombinase